MRRLAALMSLIAALTGTPLRQAEAAADLCRATTERIQPSDIEAPDGGVGDDAEVGVPSGPHTADLARPFLSEVATFLPAAPTGWLPTPAEVEALRRAVWWPPSPPIRRHAWLQSSLF